MAVVARSESEFQLRAPVSSELVLGRDQRYVIYLVA